MADPIDPEYVAAWGYFAPLTIVPVDFEEKKFSDMHEYTTFVEWLDDKVQKESVVEAWLGEPGAPRFPHIGIGEQNGFRLFRTLGGNEHWILTPPTIRKKGRFRNAETD